MSKRSIDELKQEDETVMDAAAKKARTEETPPAPAPTPASDEKRVHAFAAVFGDGNISIATLDPNSVPEAHRARFIDFLMGVAEAESQTQLAVVINFFADGLPPKDLVAKYVPAWIQQLPAEECGKWDWAPREHLKNPLTVTIYYGDY